MNEIFSKSIDFLLIRDIIILYSENEVIIMLYNKDEFENKLANWEKKLKEHKIPTWDQLPVFELYMDQVIVLVNNYLSILEMGEDRVLTPSMINNYVKQKTLPAPVKKRYSRLHVAYLIMICILKQSLSISMIQKIIPITENESEFSVIYDSFVALQEKKFSEVTKQIKNMYQSEDFSDSLIMEIAVSANIHNIIAERLGER